MGGEPTFVSIDDMDGPEWNTAANGPQKRRVAGELINRLRQRFAPGGLLHYGQGKWYPGEQLPRWALACYWRKDGQPIWNDPDLIADDREDHGHDDVKAQTFINTLAAALDLDPQFVVPGYEDTWHYLWKERRLPVNVELAESRLADPQERARLARIFETGLEKVVGYALPLEPRHQGEDTTWGSSHWKFRQDRMYLIPGDSPMGLRLPLGFAPLEGTRRSKRDSRARSAGASSAAGRTRRVASARHNAFQRPRTRHDVWIGLAHAAPRCRGQNRRCRGRNRRRRGRNRRCRGGSGPGHVGRPGRASAQAPN